MAFDAKIRLTSDTSKVDAGLAGVQRKIAGLSSGMAGAIGGLFAAGTIIAGVKNMMNFADSVQDGSERLGVTIKRFQELQLAAKLAGKDVSMFEKIFQNIDTAAQAAIGGDSKAIESFSKLGISKEQVKTKNADELTRMALQGASGMSDRSNASMLLGNLVGKKAVGSLLGMSESVINPASTGVNAVDDDTINALADAEDQMTLFVERLRNEAMPVLVKLSTMVLDFFQKMQQGFNVVMAYITTLFENIGNSPVFKSIGKMLEGDILGGFKDMGKIVRNYVATDIKSVTDVVTGKKSLGEAIGDNVSSKLGAVFGEGTVTKAEEAAASMGQVALTEDEQRQKRLDAIRASRLARQKALGADVDRTGAIGKGGAGKDISLGAAGGPSAVSYGGLIGVNAAYRLERLNVEQNEYLKEIVDLLKKDDKGGWQPPEE